MISTVGIDLPTGWVTFLFTDIEGSTRLIEELGEDGYVDALGEHHRVLRTAFAAHGGVEVGTQGDAFLYAFTDPGEGLAAAARGQQALASGPVRVRMGLHTGHVRLTREGDDYTGREVHRAARIAAAGHGGQVVVSETTAALVAGTSLRHLGPHRLKDLLEPIRLHQLVIAGLPCDFPPLRSLHRTNLPVAAWPLLGRALELRKIGGLVSGGARLVTLTGPGGSGKTRLALQAAAELSDEFPDGVFWVALASVRDRIAVRGTVAEAVGLQADAEVAAWLESRRALLVLDNLEHLAGIDATVADLLVGETTILATSRTPLRLTAERELPVEPLLDDAAIALFVSRAAAAGRPIQADDIVAAVCRRLDNLPLALELAAAKSKLLSPAALLQRLDSALPLLTGGASDRPERQRTLRATIEWSHDLLATDARTAFRRLSVFRGSFTLDAAEAVTGANLDQVAALLDQSLLKPLGDERFFLLETLGEYGRERLDGAGERNEYALRHARYYLTQLKDNETAYDSPRRAELLAWFGDEEDNFRAMLDRLSATVPADAAVAADLLKRYWVARGAYSEARDRLQNLLALTELATDSRARLLASLSEIEEWMGHLDAAEAAGHEAVELAEATHQSGVLFGGLRNLAWIADRRGDGEQAVRLQSRALELAASIDERATALALHDLGTFLTSVGRRQEAREALQLAAERARAIEYESLEVDALASVGRLDLYARDFDAADRSISLVFARGRARELNQAGQRVDAGYAALGLDRREKAIGDFAEATERMIDAGMTSHYDFSRALAGIALAAGPADARRTGRLYGATKRLRERSEFRLNGDDADLERFFEQPFIEALGMEAWEHEQAAGAALALDEAIALARSLAAPPSGAHLDQQAETLGPRPS